MPKVKTNEPPNLPRRQLPSFIVIVRRKFTKLLCPNCKQVFYVQSKAWQTKRRDGWSHAAPCPFCLRSAKIDPSEL